MKLFRKKTKVFNENWRVWDFMDENDQNGLVTYDVSYLDSKSEFPSVNEMAIDLIIPKNLTTDGYFPSPDGHAALVFHEDELIKKLEKERVHCMQVVRLTYDGARTFIFEVKDVVRFLEVVKTWGATVSGFEIKVEKYDPWMYYEKWRPNKYNWEQIGNRQVIQQLMNYGSNPDKIHKIECSFGGEPAKLEQLRLALEKEGGNHLLTEGDLLEVEFPCELDPHEIDGLTFFAMDTATEHNCKYEGWRAAIVK